MFQITEVQCIIFDCDGTLVDSEYLSHQALQQQLFEETGLSLTAELLCEQYRGAKLALILDELKTQFRFEVPEGFVLRYRERVEKLFTSELQPMPGAHDIFSQIQLPVCVASSGPLKKIHKKKTLIPTNNVKSNCRQYQATRTVANPPAR